MNTESLIHMPQCSTIDLFTLRNSSNSIWKTIESHRWVKLSCENIGLCLSYVPFTLVIRLINCWDFIQIWYDNKMLSSQWDNYNQHFVYIIISWYLLGIITRQGFLFSCSCMNRCTCVTFGLVCLEPPPLQNYISSCGFAVIFLLSGMVCLLHVLCYPHSSKCFSLRAPQME